MRSWSWREIPTGQYGDDGGRGQACTTAKVKVVSLGWAWAQLADVSRCQHLAIEAFSKQILPKKKKVRADQTNHATSRNSSSPMSAN